MKKNIPVFLLFCITLLNGCGDDPIFVSSGGYPVSGRIENWYLGSGIMLKASVTNVFNGQHFVLDSTYISSDGSFSLKLPFPPAYTLRPLQLPEDTSCINNVTITPAGVGLTDLQLNVWNDSASLGHIYRSKYESDSRIEGQFFSIDYYVDGKLDATGTTVCTYGYFIQTANYDFHSSKGWGKMVYLVTASTDSLYTVSITRTEPPGGKWFFRGWQ